MSQTEFSEFVLQRIDSRLSHTLWRLDGPKARGRGFVALEDGGGRIEGGGEEVLDGPSLLWVAHPSGLRFRAEAGSTGFVGWVSEELLARARADYAESTLLAFLTDRDQHLRAAELTTVEPAPLDILPAMHREVNTPRAGSSVVVAALFRILLIAMLRAVAPGEMQPEGSGSNAPFLQHFRQLVEANFRAHWTIRRYAEVIGISHDRLHSLCTRQLGKTPKALVAERIAREAGLGLERSTLSIEQLSYALGFRDTAHFSHFFKRMTGLPPGLFRRRMADSATQTSPLATFADWP